MSDRTDGGEPPRDSEEGDQRRDHPEIEEFVGGRWYAHAAATPADIAGRWSSIITQAGEVRRHQGWCCCTRRR